MITSPFVGGLAKATLAVAAVVAIAAGIGFAVDNALSEDPGGVARFDLTPLPYVPQSVTPPDTANPPKCKLSVDERPGPDLPPLSCRHEDNEPKTGVIPTAPLGTRPSIQPTPPGWVSLDNALFRFTVAHPSDWYSDMRPEGGTFTVQNPAATADELSAGVLIIYSAHDFEPAAIPEYRSIPEQKLATPNTKFGDIPGAIWDEGPGEGLAHIIFGAYLREGVLFLIQGNVVDGARTPGEIQTDVDLVYAVLATVTPY